jgi:hypothetical protein
MLVPTLVIAGLLCLVVLAVAVPRLRGLTGPNSRVPMKESVRVVKRSS